MSRQRAQVLVFFAIALPLILLPIAAYAVDAATAATAYSRLVEVTTQAAEDAVQDIDVARLRAGRGLNIDIAAATATAREVIASAEPGATVVSVTVIGQELRLVTTETVVLPLDVLGPPRVALHARVTARIAPGYDSPSSLLPLPVSNL